MHTSRPSRWTPTSPPCSETLLLENDLESISALVSDVRQYFVDEGVFDEPTSLRVSNAVDEALQNAYFHGNLEVDSALRDREDDAYHDLANERLSQPPYRDRRIRFHMTVDEAEVRFTIGDEGPGFEAKDLPDPTSPEFLERPFGRGLLLMRAFADEVRYNERGNEVTLVKHRTNGHSSASS